MYLVVAVILLSTSACVKGDPGQDLPQGELNAEEARQKIYDIISSHEDRKYGEHGGHEYEEGEVPKRSSSRKSKLYDFLPEDAKYYYEKQPQKAEVSYQPKAVYANKPVPEHYSAQKAYYPVPKERYPVVDAVYALPKRGYITRENAEAVRKRYRPVYSVPKEDEYHDAKYVENRKAPISIGQTARTVYAGPNTHYADPKAPSEYITLDGQKPKPLILDPKLKATYHLYQPDQYSELEPKVVKAEIPVYKTAYVHQPDQYSEPEHKVVKAEVPVPVYKTAYVHQPVAHYSEPQHQVVLKPEVLVPVHYSTPVKEYVKYDDHKLDDRGHHASGHGYHGDNLVRKESGHKSHGQHETAGHKAHSTVGAQHDEYGRHHNKGLYERDRGYHYEKAYAYDRVRAHHDIAADKGSRSAYGAHHGQEGHKDSGHHGAQVHSHYRKGDLNSGYGYNNGNSLYKKDHNYGQKYVPVYYTV